MFLPPMREQDHPARAREVDVPPADLHVGGGEAIGAGGRQSRLRAGKEREQREAAELQVAADAPRSPRPCLSPRDKSAGVKQYTNARGALPEPYQPKQRIKGDVLFKKLVEEVEN